MKRFRRPSGGFICIIATYTLVLLFFGWGLQTPDLDKIWTLHHLLKIGQKAQLTEDEKQLLNQAMDRHNELARDLLDNQEIGIISAHKSGWIATRTATILRTQQATDVANLALNVHTPNDLYPFSIQLTGKNWNKTLKIEKSGKHVVDLPKPEHHSEIIEVTLKGKGLDPDPSILGTQILFSK